MIEILNPHDADLALPDEGALIPAVVQDDATRRVLMLAWMNRDALDRTCETGRATFWSRSRETLWEKGETSGNALHVSSIRIDCDGDALLVRARPTGPVCHTGSDTCWDEMNPPVTEAGSETEASGFLSVLESIVDERIESGGDESYTARLVREGSRTIGQKVGEEGVEVALEAIMGDDGRLLEESADLLYHLVVLLRARGKRIADVEDVLERRHTG